MACCGAFLVTPRIQGNRSYLIALSALRRATSDGFVPPSYWRFHSAKAPLYANLATPQARRKCNSCSSVGTRRMRRARIMPLPSAPRHVRC
jgi:hypothetical protein